MPGCCPAPWGQEWVRIISGSAESFLIPAPHSQHPIPILPPPAKCLFAHPLLKPPHQSRLPTPQPQLGFLWAVIAGAPRGALCAGFGTEASRPLCSVTMTAARRRCPRRAEWPQDGWGLAAAPSSSSSSSWPGAAGCLCQVLGAQGQSGRGMLCCTVALVPFRAGHGGKGRWGRRGHLLWGAPRHLRCWQMGGGHILPAWAGCSAPGAASARALPAAEWRRGAIRQLCSVQLRLQGAAASNWSWGTCTRAGGACTRAGGLQAPRGAWEGACQG